MKKTFFSCVVFFTFIAAQASALLVDKKFETLRMIPQKTYIPEGFDNNDTAQIVLYGKFPDTCYRLGQTRTEIDHENKSIVVQHYVYRFVNSICAQVQVPYATTINLGILNSGAYKVYFKEESGELVQQGEIPVALSQTNSPDNLLYAPVEEVLVEPISSQPNEFEVILRGTFNSNCMRIKEVLRPKTKPGTLELLPIAEFFGSTQDCKSLTKTFEYRVNIGTPLSSTLFIHVRSLNGQSLNKVKEFDRNMDPK